MKEVLRHNVEIVEEFPGSDLIGRSYEPLFPVTTTDGTGRIHTAVMYGEDDYNLGMEVGLPDPILWAWMALLSAFMSN